MPVLADEKITAFNFYVSLILKKGKRKKRLFTAIFQQDKIQEMNGIRQS